MISKFYFIPETSDIAEIHSPVPVSLYHLVDIMAADYPETQGTYVSAAMIPSDAYICVGELAIIGSDNGLSPGRRQAII